MSSAADTIAAVSGNDSLCATESATQRTHRVTCGLKIELKHAPLDPRMNLAGESQLC